MLLWPNGSMDEDATWYGSRPRRRPHCIRRIPSAPRKDTALPPLLGPCLLWPRSPISATAELLYNTLRSVSRFCATLCNKVAPHYASGFSSMVSQMTKCECFVFFMFSLNSRKLSTELLVELKVHLASLYGITSRHSIICFPGVGENSICGGA